MVYNRPWKSFEEQLNILESRGMVIGDRQQALAYLERIGYYRLSAYWYPFRQFLLIQDTLTQKISSKVENNFHEGTHFLDAVNLYLFDKQLRLQVTDALERIEVAIRVDIAYLLGERDTFAHQNQNEFHPKFSNRKISGKPRFKVWQDKSAGLVNRSKEDFVSHYRTSHGPDLPIWVAIETWDFGAMSQLFAMMKVPDQQKIARKYGVDDFKVFASWLRSLNYLRNLTAHHSRLWNRNIIDQPKMPKAGDIDWCDGFIGKKDLIARPFLLIAILRHLIRTICPNTSWHLRLRQHLEAFPETYSASKRSIQDMGAPKDWETWWE
jgi:abortive infection bacteriophage resistance protein